MAQSTSQLKTMKKSEEIRISIYNHRNDGHTIGYLESGGWHSRNSAISERSLNTHCMDDIERFLFRLYCAQTEIDVSDIDELCDFSVGGYEY